MSNTPKLDFEERQRTQQVYEECCENPEDFAYNFVALQGELAAAQERIAQLESTLIDVQNYGQKRIAELERERNYLVNVLYKAREDCIEDNDCCAWLLLNQTCARYPSTGKSK